MIQGTQFISLAEQRQVMLQSTRPRILGQPERVPLSRHLPPGLLLLQIPVVERGLSDRGSVGRSPLRRRITVGCGRVDAVAHIDFEIVKGVKTRRGGRRHRADCLCRMHSRCQSRDRHPVPSQIAELLDPRRAKDRDGRVFKELRVVCVCELDKLDQVVEHVGGALGAAGGRRNGCRDDDGVTHPFEQLMERDLPQSGRDVVPLRQRVQAGGDVRVERHLQERVVGFRKPGGQGKDVSGLRKSTKCRLLLRTHCLCALASLTQYSSSYFLP